jgi:hypothetical protein
MTETLRTVGSSFADPGGFAPSETDEPEQNITTKDKSQADLRKKPDDLKRRGIRARRDRSHAKASVREDSDSDRYCPAARSLAIFINSCEIDWQESKRVLLRMSSVEQTRLSINFHVQKFFKFSARDPRT